METKHTPGPWKIRERDNPFNHAERKPGSVKIVNNDPVLGPIAEVWINQSDARLIAAAPDMLEALQELFNVLTVSGLHSYKPTSETGIAIELARAAIAKATGK